MRTALVCGAGGFIGSHLVKRLKAEGYFVRGADLKWPEFSTTEADEFFKTDLRDASVCRTLVDGMDEVYQLAADMGGAGYIFTGEHDADVMHNSATINLNILDGCVRTCRTQTLFYSSSACVYPEHNQLDPDNPLCREDTAYPAAPDSEYGWEKLFSERLYFSYARNYGMQVRVARFHNIFGPEGSWNNGKEKAPAAICRKVSQAPNGGEVEVWGDGLQTRSFLYIDECLEGVRRLMRSDFEGPVNIGSEEMVSINGLVDLVAAIAAKDIVIKNVPGPLGVRGRKSDNSLIDEKLGWKPGTSLHDGLEVTYNWIDGMVRSDREATA